VPLWIDELAVDGVAVALEVAGVVDGEVWAVVGEPPQATTSSKETTATPLTRTA
jgi:hypothetical protein